MRCSSARELGARLGLLALVAGVGCDGNSAIHVSPSRMRHDAWATTTFVVTGLRPEQYLERTSSAVVPASDLRAWLGTEAMVVTRAGGDGIDVTLDHEVADGLYDVRVEARGDSWLATGAVEVYSEDGGSPVDASSPVRDGAADASSDAGSGFDAGADASTDAGIDGGPIDAAVLDGALACSSGALCPACGSAGMACCTAGCLAGGCMLDCTDGCACGLDCTAATRGRCDVRVDLASSTQVGCTGGADCRTTCSASDCEMDCTGAASCEMRCRTGSRCLVHCAGAVSCTISVCSAGMRMSCPGGIEVCGRACP